MKIKGVINSIDLRDLVSLVDNKTHDDGTIWVRNKGVESWHIKVSKREFFDFNEGKRGEAVEFLEWIEKQYNCNFAGKILTYIEQAEAEVEIFETKQAFRLKGHIAMMTDGLRNY